MLARSIWGVADQAINSVSSLVLAVMVARVSSPEDVGSWAIAYAIYTFLLVVSRSTLSTTALITKEISRDNSCDSSLDRASSTLSLLLGLAAGAIMVLSAFVFSGSLSPFLLCFGLGLPLLLWQDSIRYTLIRKGRPKTTALMDSIWLLVQVFVGLLVSNFGFGGASVTSAWVFGVVCSLLVGLSCSRVALSLRAGMVFLRENVSVGGKLLVESLLNAGTANFLPVLLGAVLGLAATGYFRGALTLIGVAGIFVMGLTPIATVELLPRSRDWKFTFRFLIMWSSALAVCGVVLLVGFRYLSDSAGVSLLGETWFGTREILLIMSAQVIFRGPLTGVPIILRAAHELDAAVKLRFTYSMVFLVITVGCAAAWDVRGAAWGFTGAGFLGSCMATYRYWKFLTKVRLL